MLQRKTSTNSLINNYHSSIVFLLQNCILKIEEQQAVGIIQPQSITYCTSKLYTKI